jgi:hypothetical protein
MEMRCPYCGFDNPGEAERCGRCGQELRAMELQQEAVAPSLGYAARLEAQPLELEQEARSLIVAPQPRALALGLWPRRPEPDLVGTVIAADAVYYEPPDLDALRLLNRALLLLEFLGLPFMLLWALLKFAGPFSLILGILGLYLFFRFISPGNLLALLGIFHLLRPTRAREDQVPVQYFRVRDRSGQEHLVRRKGHLRSGHIMPGDEVALWGSWRGGVLHLRGGLNVRTQAQIALRSSYSWVWLALNLVILSLFLGLFYEPLWGLLNSISR